MALWPDCAKQGCGLPGLFRFEFVEDGRKIVAFLCPSCILEAPRFLEEIAAVKEQDHLTASQPKIEGPPPEEE